MYDISFVNCYGPLKQKLKISYLSNFVLARPSDAFFIFSKEGHFISNTKEEGSHYLLLLDRPWTWPEAGKGRKRGLKMSAQPLRGFLAGTMQRKTCCCLISQVANLRFFLPFFLQKTCCSLISQAATLCSNNQSQRIFEKYLEKNKQISNTMQHKTCCCLITQVATHFLGVLFSFFAFLIS